MRSPKAKVHIAVLGAVAALCLGLLVAGCGDARPSAAQTTATTIRQATGTVASHRVIVRNNLQDEILLTVDKVDNGDWRAGQNPADRAPNGLQEVKIAPGGRYSADLAAYYTDPPATWELSIVQRQTNYLLARADLVSWWAEANIRGGLVLRGFVPEGGPFTSGPHALPAIPGIDERTTVSIGISTTYITIAAPQ